MALDGLRTNTIYRARYADFIAAMVYGDHTEFDEAMATVVAAVEAWLAR